jgi:hypothetical protein
MRRTRGVRVKRRRARADETRMDVITAANLQIQAMVLGNAREQIERRQENPLPASAPASAQAEVILALSSAAENLLTR